MSAQPGLGFLSWERIQGLVGTAGGRRGALLLLCLLLAGQYFVSNHYDSPIRRAIFDLYQQVSPRKVERITARIIVVDEASLEALGQWPWPRYRLAQLIEATIGLGALAVGLDIIMPEPDRLSPAVLASTHPGLDTDLRERLGEVPSNDATLAETFFRLPVVAARVGFEEGGLPPVPLRFPPIVTHGESPMSHLTAYGGLLVNVPELESSAAGHGLVNRIIERDGVARRVPVVARIGEDLLTSLPLEILRVATGAGFVKVVTDDSGIQGVGLEDEMFFPTDADGTLRLHFSRSNPQRRLSAVAVLNGTVPADALAGQVAIIGVTALGTVDAPPTPVAGRMDGVEVQAQVVESLLEGVRLTRPRWASWAELLALALFGGVVIIALPRLGAQRGLAVVVVLVALLAIAAVAAFVDSRVLLDPSYSMVAIIVLAMLMLASLFAQAVSRARELDAQLAEQRLATARLAGELDAARNIQMGILPDPRHIEGLPPTVELDAKLEPAREVGGDLYDAFMVDDRYLFFLVGDVSGKGIPASLFMALSKALCKSIVLRAKGEIADRLSLANEEISRENPELLFVTVIAGLLDTSNGKLELCVAGHDAPYRLRADAEPEELETIGGPPFCALDDFPYPNEQFDLEPGDVLVMTTDGVGEAMDAAGALYGRERTETVLRNASAHATPHEILDALYQDVKRYSEGTEPTDDITIMVVRYLGPSGGAQAPLSPGSASGVAAAGAEG